MTMQVQVVSPERILWSGDAELVTARTVEGGKDGRNPWWELDLGSEQRIERIAIHNRGEGQLSNRLSGFTLVVLDGNRAEVFRLENQPTPSLAAEFQLISEEARLASEIRRAAFAAIVSVPGREAEAFRLIAPFVRTGVDRDAAIAALLFAIFYSAR